MDYLALRNELLNDPLTRGYSGMTDVQAAASLNTANRSISRALMDSAEIFENTDITEFQAKTNAQQATIRDIWGLGANVRIGVGSKARTVYVNVFGAGSTTITNLAAAANTTVSRAVELGLGYVAPGDVAIARSGVW